MGRARTDVPAAAVAPMDAGGRGPIRARVLNGVLWVLRTGAPVARSARVAIRRIKPAIAAFSSGNAAGRLDRLLQAARRGSPRPRQTRSQRSLRRRHLRRGEKGGAAVGPTRRGKGSKIMAICDRHGLPLAVHVASASPYEAHLVPATLDARFLADLPTRLIGDRGYDSDGLDAQLADGLRHRDDRRRIGAAARRTQDGRPLRRAKRRWKIERLFAWLHNSRRLVTRWERSRRELLSACCSSPAPASCSGIYEISSSLDLVQYPSHVVENFAGTSIGDESHGRVDLSARERRSESIGELGGGHPSDRFVDRHRRTCPPAAPQASPHASRAVSETSPHRSCASST